MGKASTIMPTKGVRVHLDKDRTLRYTMRSLAWLAEKHGSVGKAVEVCQNMDKGNAFTHEELYAIADIIYAGLFHEDDTITVKAIMDMELGDLIAIMPLVLSAFMESMPSVNKSAKAKEDSNPQKA